MAQQQAEQQQDPASHLPRIESAPAAMENIATHTKRKAAAEKLRRMSDDVHEWRFDFRSVMSSYQSSGSFVRHVVRRVSLSLWGESCQEESEEEEEEKEAADVANRKLQRPNSIP